MDDFPRTEVEEIKLYPTSEDLGKNEIFLWKVFKKKKLRDKGVESYIHIHMYIIISYPYSVIDSSLQTYLKLPFFYVGPHQALFDFLTEIKKVIWFNGFYLFI